MSNGLFTSILSRNPTLWAVWENVLSWFVRSFAPSFRHRLIPYCPHELKAEDSGDKSEGNSHTVNTQCVIIGRPGGLEQLRHITLHPGTMTCGYNLGVSTSDGLGGPFVTDANALMLANSQSETGNNQQVLVVVRVEAFSVNFADCCIRWGLYGSANQYVGYPICPGFDIAGVVERFVLPDSLSPSSHNLPFRIGDKVYGCSLFGAYSTRVLVPDMQLRKVPSSLSMDQAASLPAVALTALYALFLAGQYFPLDSDGNKPSHLGSKNRAILIHSAAGGVGSMMCQMAKILGMSPIVGVVGRSAKIDVARELGCDVVIDKSSCKDMC